MPMLPEQPIPLRFARLGGDVDPKSGAKGQCELLENTQSRRLEDGGVEIEKRPGTPSINRITSSGPSITAGKQVSAFGDELVMTDGSLLYSRREIEAKWTPRGRVADIGAIVGRVEANQGTLAIDPDVAYANGYLLFTASRSVASTGLAEFYLVDATSGALVATGSVGGGNLAYKVRVVASATVFFVFSWDGPAGTSIRCQKLDTAAAISGLSAATVVANNVLSTARYDVIRDTTNGRTVVGYRNTTPTTTLMIWNDNMTAGTTVAYATRSSDSAIGFLDWDFSDGNGYVATAGAAYGVRVLTFGSSSMTVGPDTLVDAASVATQRVTGYYSGAKRNVFYVPNATLGWNRPTMGWCDPTGFTVYRSVIIAGRCFSMQGKRYMMVAYMGDAAVSKQNSVFLLEMVTDTTNATPGDISVAAVLAAGDASGTASLQRAVGGVAAVSSTKAVLAFSSAAEIAIPGSTASMSQEALARATLDWTGTLTGRPVKHNGLLYLPQATAKLYDGHAVLEIGPHLYPEAPTLTAGAGGSLTASTTYKYTALYFRYDATGKLIQSAPSFAATLTLAAGETKITVDVPTLRITEADAAYNLNPLVTPWRIALYRTAANGSDFRLVSVLSNSLTVDTVQLVDTAADTTIAVNPEPYTSTGEVDNVIPAAVLAFESHRDRLFAMASDTIYPSKETSGGVATSFAADTDGFFLEFDTAADGPLISQVSDGTSLFIASRHRVYPLQGDGPNLSATPETAYQFPSPLPAENGVLGARSYVGTPDGILTGTSKGKHLLDRAGGMQPIPGADVYDSLTVTGGVTLDDRPMALLTTQEGRTLCWDWQLKTWHTWTGQPAVSCCRWQNKFVWMESNGKVHVETPGLFADDAGAYTWVVQLSWVDMVHAYLKRIEVIGEAFGTCTLTALGSYDYDEANVDTSRSGALAVSGPKAPWILEPDQGYCEAYNLKLTETSTTQGVKLAKLLAWVGLLPGSHKHAPAQYAT